MAYDKTKDKVLAEIASVVLDEKTNVRLKVEICSYDNGEPKISLVKRGEKWVSPNIGRLTLENIEKLLPHLLAAKQWLQERPDLKGSKS